MTQNARSTPWPAMVEAIFIIGTAALLVLLLQEWIKADLPLYARALLGAALLALLAGPPLAWRLGRSGERPPSPQAVAGFWSGMTQVTYRLPNWLWSASVLLAGVALSLTAAHDARQRIEETAQERFEQQVHHIAQNITDRFDSILHSLRGLDGLYRSSREVTREEFRVYWAARDLAAEFPGVRGFGYIEEVPRTRLPQFIAAQRRDAAPDFEVKTKGQADTLYIITMLEPLAKNRPAVGLDLGAEAVRHQAVEQALLQHRPVLSGVITLVQDNKRGPGFLYLLPTELAAGAGAPKRRGLVYSPIVVDELLNATHLQGQGMIEFELYDGPAVHPEKTLYRSAASAHDPARHATPAQDAAAHYEDTRSLHIAGHAFSLRAYSTPAFDATVDTSRPLMLGIGGSLLSLLLALAVWLLSRGQAQAEERARQMSAGLQRLATVAKSTSNGVVIANARFEIEWVNDAFLRISGLDRTVVLGQSLTTLRALAQHYPNEVNTIRTELQAGLAVRQQSTHRRPDGSEYWIDSDIHPILDDQGRFNGFVAVETDITQEKQTNQKLYAALRDNQALMQTINTHAIVSEANPDGEITHVNQNFLDICGYGRDKIIGQDHRLLNSGLHSKDFWARMWNTISAGQPWRGQICNRARDGRLYWVDSLISPFLDAQGKIERYVSIRFDITASKTAEEQLRREQQRLENIIEGTGVATWEIDFVTGRSQIDANWAAMLGYTLQELQPMSEARWLALLHPEDHLPSRQALIDHIKGRTPLFEVERRLRHKNGHWIWVLARARVAARAANGRAERIAGTHLDITERRVLFEQVEHSNQHLQAVLNNLPCGLTVFDAQQRLVISNPRYRQIMRVPDEFFEQQPVEFQRILRVFAERGEFGPGDPQDLIAPILARVRGNQPRRLTRQRADGSSVEITDAPLPGGGWITTYTDISDLTRAEAEAKRSEAMLRAAIDALDEAFVMYDPQDRLVMCNQRYLDLYALAAPMIKPGNTFEQIIRYGAERGEYKAAIGRVDEWVADRLKVHLAADSDLLQELDTGRVLRILERKTMDGYIVGFRIDVTDLVQAKAAAEAASRSKSQFLANMSHEIRTPMNAILGMLSLLQGTAMTAQQIDYAGKAQGAAQSLLGLLNDILDFSKIEAGKMTLDNHPFRLDQLMRDLAVIMSANTGSKDLEILFDLDPDLPKALVGDSLRIKQVLINLGGNAIKFTQQGEIVVRIRVLERVGLNITLEFSVKDSGIGIAPEHLERIFEGFSQAEASTTRRFGGTGLGLAISSRLVQMMGGQLGVESTQGQGSTFHFTVPMVVDSSAQESSQEQAEALRDLHVLIVDDNMVAREVLEDMSSAMGWKASVVGSGAEALASIEARAAAGEAPFQAIFVDWAMPKMDGWETCTQIRQAAAGKNMPLVIMVTAHGRELLAQHPIEQQAMLDGYLVKPVTASMLLDAVMDARAQAAGLQQVVAPVAKARRLLGLKVLVVEDNKINQQVASELLRREGADVTLADNGALGVQAVNEAAPPFQVVLMDVQMPVMDGHTATRTLRRQGEWEQLPIIAMTANAMVSDRQDCLAAGMNDHVGKPIDIDQLVATILRHTHYQPPAEATVAHVSDSAPLEQPPAAAIGLSGGDLDVKRALDRMGGDVHLYAQILRSLGQSLEHICDTLIAHLQAGETEEARRLMHTLKGTAATIGAMPLSAQAAMIESELKQGTALKPDDGLIADLRRAVELTLRDVHPLLEQLHPQAAGPGASAVPLDEAQLHQDLLELLRLLEQSDMAALELHAHLRDTHGDALGDAMTALDTAMSDLDFASAKLSCAQLLQEYP